MADTQPAADPLQRWAWIFSGLFVVLWSTGFIGAKLGLPYAEPATFLVIRFAVVLALLLLAPYSLLCETRATTWSAHLLIAMVWLVFALSLGAVFLLFWLIRHGAATKVASLMYLVPPCTALIAWPLFGETYTAFSAAGMGLAMLGVWLVTKG